MGAFDGAGAAGISSAVDIGMGLYSAQQSSHEAKKARRWQQYMYENAHQKEVADLKAAGLNPILSANGNSSVPGASPAHIPDMSGIGTKAVSTALQAQYNKKIIDKTSEEVKTQQLQNELLSETIKYYREHPELQDAVNAAMLGKQSGVGGVTGAVVGAATSAKEFTDQKIVPFLSTKLANIISSAKGKERERAWKNDLDKLIKEIEDSKFKERERYERK